MAEAFLLAGQIKEGTLNFARICGAVMECVREMPERVSSLRRRGWADLGEVRSIPSLRAFSPSAHSGGKQSGFIERARALLNVKFYRGVGEREVSV